MTEESVPCQLGRLGVVIVLLITSVLMLKRTIMTCSSDLNLKDGPVSLECSYSYPLLINIYANRFFLMKLAIYERKPK